MSQYVQLDFHDVLLIAVNSHYIEKHLTGTFYPRRNSKTSVNRIHSPSRNDVFNPFKPGMSENHV